MRKKSGFTLIELMVVMAIIAILATAGLSAYGGYIKKARDATRIEDMRALETIAISSFSLNGMSVSLSDFKDAVENVNNGQLLIDPLDGTDVCMTNDGYAELECAYYYFQCDNGGYVLKVRFESTSNTPLYAEDKLNADSGGAASANSYDIGNCDTPIVTGTDYIR